MLNKELNVISGNIQRPEKQVMLTQIASTTVRMFEHLDRLQEIKRTGKIRPIMIHLAPTDACNLECSWCSTAKRAKNVMKYKEAVGIIDTYSDLGIKSVEITGGGDPTTWEYLPDLIHYIKDEKKLDVGMITNGLLLNRIEEDALKKLTWMRISLSGIEFGDQDNVYMQVDPNRLPEFTGCSFVFTPKTMQNDFLERVNRVANHLETKYIRVVPNCYNPEDVEWTRMVAPKLLEPFPKMFMQAKENKTPSRCYWKYIKPFVNSDGYVYQCSTNSLFTGNFSEKWRVAHWTEIKDIYEKRVESYDTSNCPFCFYTEQNQLLTDLFVDVKHKNFF